MWSITLLIVVWVWWYYCFLIIRRSTGKLYSWYSVNCLHWIIWLALLLRLVQIINSSKLIALLCPICFYTQYLEFFLNLHNHSHMYTYALENLAFIFMYNLRPMYFLNYLIKPINMLWPSSLENLRDSLLSKVVCQNMRCLVPRPNRVLVLLNLFYLHLARIKLILKRNDVPIWGYLQQA